jgi:hypothetical protein
VGLLDRRAVRPHGRWRPVHDVGAFGISRFAAEPNYDVLLDGDPEQSPGRWSAARHRYFVLNWARAGLVSSALACFAGAALLEWN